jgi:hypothetical protein
VGLCENDIATLMHDYRLDLGPLFEALESHLSASDIATLRDIVADIRHRIERFGREFGEKP